MANVKFLRGSQSNFNAIKDSAVYTDGTFYLTEDTHKLYVGKGTTEPILLNSCINFIGSEAELKTLEGTWTDKSIHVNDIYYIVPHYETENGKQVFKGNQLLLYTYENGKPVWHQINPDHNDNTKIKSVTAVTATSGTDKVITTSTITDTDNQPHDSQIVTQAGNGIKVEATTTTIGGKDLPVIKISGDKFTLGSSVASNAATLKLTSERGQTGTGSVVIEGGNNVTIDKNGSNIRISSTDTNWLPNASSSGLTYNNTEGKLSLVLSQTGGQTFEWATDVLGVKVHNGTNVYKLGEALPVYTIDEIDAKMRDLNGMTYVGTITSNQSGDESGTWKMTNLKATHSDTSITNNDIHQGDMFLVTSSKGVAYNSNNDKAYKGDLLIATGTEKNGKLETVVWEYVPSANDTDTHYFYKTINESGGTVMSVHEGSKTNAAIATFGVKPKTGTPIGIEYEATADGKRYIATVKHTGSKATEATTTTSIGSNLQFSAITAIEGDNFGHVTKVTKQNFTIPGYSLNDTGNVIPEGGSTPTKTKVTIQQGLKLNNGTNAWGSNVDITSNSLELTTTTGSNVNIDIVWGSF